MQFAATKGDSVNLAEAFPRAWDKVCVLGPYSNNEDAKQTLGFNWNVEGKTSIRENDGISVLLFVRSNEVVAYVEHPRNKGDFSNLATKCYSRQQAVFFHNPAPGIGRPGLFPKGGA